MAAACSSAPTSIRLEVTIAAGVNVDALVVTLDGAAPVTRAVGPELMLQVPDAWAGDAHALTVAGLQLGVPVADGRTQVTPVRGEEVVARVTLVRTDCPASCEPGATRCTDQAVETCVVTDGCPAWGMAMACPAAAPFCVGGACASSCADNCMPGASVCEGAEAVRTCGNHDTDPCLEWGAAEACPPGELCAASACTAAYALTVVTTGTGGGLVTSTPPGISCGADCTATYPAGTSVQLIATPGAGATFDGWSGGGCSGTGTCAVTMSAAATVTAAFGGACTDECTRGATRCAGTGAEQLCGDFDTDACAEWGPAVACGADQICSANACMTAPVLTVVKVGTGAGTVTSIPAGIDCGAACSRPFPGGTSITLRASPTGADAFGGWSGGGCTGTGDCVVTLATATTVTAAFAGACAPTGCTQPPPPICVNVFTLRTSTTPGSCAGGTCSYPHTDETCAIGCNAGHCSRWIPIPAGGPSARYGHTAVWTGTEMIVWGGWGGGAELNNGGRYNPATGQWTLIPAGGPSVRSGHTAVWTGTEMIVWGGHGAGGNHDDGGRYDPATGQWTLISSGGPSARVNHAAVWTGTEMIVWGGHDGADRNDGARFDPATGQWTPLPAAGPSARHSHTAVWTGTEMLVWGGVSTGVKLNDGGRFRPSTAQWNPILSGGPVAREEHTGVWTGTEMIVWGGRDIPDDGGRYAPLTSAWIPILAGGPARAEHAAVWTGAWMVVWGGYYGVARNDGGILQ